MSDVKKLIADMDAAREFRGDQRAMRITLECGHLRLSPYINTIMGIGAWTICSVCDKWSDRRVVNIEETGVLYEDSWYS